MLGGEGGEDGVALSGVRVRAFFLMTLGSSVWAQGLTVTTRSRKARSKTECSMVWYFRTLAANRPCPFPVSFAAALAVVTQRWISDGRILPIGRLPMVGMKWLVEVGAVGGEGGGLDVFTGQPDGFDVLGSVAAASRIRSGSLRPHRRHWAALQRISEG